MPRACRLILFLALLVTASAGAAAERPAVGEGLRKVSAYQLRAEDGSGLLFLGTVHTNDPDDPQIKDMQEQFAAFEPTVVLVEGGSWPVAESPADAVSRYGEMGYAYFLARKSRIAVADADPDFVTEIEHVAAIHGAEKTKVWYALRMVRQFRQEADQRPVEQKMADWLRAAEFENVPALRGQVMTLTALDAACRTLLPRLDGWQNVPTDWSATPFAAVQKSSMDFRDTYLTRQLVARMGAGERVLVVAGLAHLDAQRAHLRAALEAK